MKFKVNSEIFKQAAERVSVLVNKKSSIAYCYSVRLKADVDKQTVTATVNNMEELVDVIIPATVEESGYVYVDCDVLKRVFSIKGYITISADGNNLKCTNGKKSGICATMELQSLADQYSINDDHFVTAVSTEEFISVICNVGKFADCKSVKPSGQCIYFDLHNAAVVASDGYRMMMYSTKHWDIKAALASDILVKADMADHLKKIIDRNKDNIKLYADDKYFYVTTAWLRYRVRQVKETFFDYRKALPSSFIATVSLNDNELMYDTVKEYTDLTKGLKGIKSIYTAVELKEDEMIVGIRTPQYCTVDRLSIKNNENGAMITGYNPQYWLDCLKVYKQERLVPEYHFCGELSPVTITAGNYTYLLWPVRVEKDKVSNLFKQLIA